MNKEENFIMLDENGTEKEARIITIIEVDNIEYVVYAIDKDNESDDILVSEIVIDENGNKSIKSIAEEKKDKIFNIVKELINEVGNE